MTQNRLLSAESELVAHAVTGDVQAFDILFQQYRPVLTQLAMRMLMNREDANDVVQETFVKAFRAIGDFQPDRPLKPWLCRICQNACVDVMRARKRTGEPLENHEYLLCTEDDSDVRINTNLVQKQLLDAIGRLPVRYQRIVLMRHFKHMEVNEIAAELSKPEGTIKSWLFRARSMLRKDLTPAFG